MLDGPWKAMHTYLYQHFYHNKLNIHWFDIVKLSYIIIIYSKIKMESYLQNVILVVRGIQKRKTFVLRKCIPEQHMH